LYDLFIAIVWANPNANSPSSVTSPGPLLKGPSPRIGKKFSINHLY